MCISLCIICVSVCVYTHVGMCLCVYVCAFLSLCLSVNECYIIVTCLDSTCGSIFKELVRLGKEDRF